MKKHLITIAGVPGSGKSSTAQGVASALGYEHFSSGDLFRKIAAERGISIEQMNVVAEGQKTVDKEVDELLTRMGKEKNDLVIDSRLAFHWIPDSFKVFLALDLATAAARTFAQIEGEGRVSQGGSSLEEVKRNTAKRIESEHKRYQDLYGIDFADPKNFDLVLDTGKSDLESVVATIVAAYNNWLYTP